MQPTRLPALSSVANERVVSARNCRSALLIMAIGDYV
jgi:hypothetical protein